jgi:hydroxyacylglutathione hydrolase
MATQLIHERFPVGLLQCNCSIVGDPETREAIVIDPGDDVERIDAIITKYGLVVRAILCTHAHIDHVGGLKKLQESTHAPVMMNEADLELYRNMDIQAEWLGVPPPPTTKIEGLLKEGDTVRWGTCELRVLATPGHTPGSISLYVPVTTLEVAERHVVIPGARQKKNSDGAAAPWLFSGDTLFAGSVGRTDLWGGSHHDLIRSIHLKLLSLPMETVVFPGHGPTTTLEVERKSNPFLRTD